MYGVLMWEKYTTLTLIAVNVTRERNKIINRTVFLSRCADFGATEKLKTADPSKTVGGRGAVICEQIRDLRCSGIE